MRIRIIAIVGACTAVAGCGAAGGTAPTQSRPPSPINLTVYVNDSRISVSPSRVGAGPVVFIVTNQASKAEQLAVSRPGMSSPIASTAPINPQGTTQVSVNFRPGDYTIATQRHGTDAELSRQPSIRSASIHIGRERANGSDNLLQP
ncbi:MAG TPA: hypothetical protein VN880_06045 [Solirubrobacteraceae bacterium]|jgi:hypothetical protein|nr:hypothetical protein [Solirubrobacteraceae bacterium]